MRPAFALLLGLLPLSAPTKEEPVPVLVELYTSEGCSSCPPADALLARLMARPEPGVKVVALGFHVDYWDQLGWKDPFASPAWSERQRNHSGGGGLYTPQMTVNGGPGFVGSDEATARARLREATVAPHLPLTLQREGDHLRISGMATGEPVELWLAWTEEDLSSAVGRGENAGRRLVHASVARSLQRLPLPPPTATWKKEVPVAPPEGTKGRPKTVVAFLQSPKTGVVRGVATISL